MKARVAIFVAVGMLVFFSCKKDKDDTPKPPAEPTFTAKIDGKEYTGTNGRTKIDPADATLKIGKNMKLVSNEGDDKGLLLAIELTDNKLKPGKYSLTPRSDGTLPAFIFYAEDLDQTESINYASYYVKKADQKGEINITTVNDSAIIATFKGTVLTAFGDVEDITKEVTEGSLYIKL